ncbi:MAG: hypothetical protein ACT4PT_14270 [Methanobacteriota archaeon]
MKATFTVSVLVLAMAGLVGLSSEARADTCAASDPTVEALVCPPILGVFCTLYNPKGAVACAKRSVPRIEISCETICA